MSYFSDLRTFFTWRTPRPRRRRPVRVSFGRPSRRPAFTRRRRLGETRSVIVGGPRRFASPVFPRLEPPPTPLLPAAVLPEPQAVPAFPVAPAGPVETAPAARVRKSFFLRPRPDGVPDILDAIQDLGGIAAPSQSRFADKGDYDGFREAFTGPARLLVRSAGGNPPDKLVQALTDPEGGAGQIFRLDSTSDLYDAVAAAVEGRYAAKKQMRQEQVDAAFYESALTPKRRRLGCAAPVNSSTLRRGDKFRVRGEECEVSRADPVEVAARCGARFHSQVFPAGADFYPDRCEVMKTNPTRKHPAQMTAGEINRELDRLDKLDTNLTDQMIAAGRGHERPSDYFSMSDPLSIAMRDKAERFYELRQEIRARYGPGMISRLPSRGFGPRSNPALSQIINRHGLGREFYAELRKMALRDRFHAIRYLRGLGWSFPTASKWVRETLENKPWTFPPRRGQFTAGEPRVNPAGDLFGAPESVEEQRARIEREAAAALRRQQREELEARRTARLVGRSVDTTGELFDPTAGDAPLFAVKRKNPAKIFGYNPVGRFAIQDSEGRFASYNMRHGPSLTSNPNFAYTWDNLSDAEQQRKLYEDALGVSLKVIPFSTAKRNPARCRSCRHTRKNVVTRRGITLYAERRAGAWTIRSNQHGGLVLASGLSDAQVRTWARQHGYQTRRKQTQ